MTSAVTDTPRPKAMARVKRDAHPQKLEAHRVGRQAQATRRLPPEITHEAKQYQRKTERCHRTRDRVGGDQPRRDQAAIGQRNNRRDRNADQP